MAWNEILSSGIQLVTVGLLILNFGKSNKKEAVTEGGTNATLASDIGYVKAGIDEIKRKQDLQDARYIELVQRMSKVEASAVQAHKRIDEHIKEEK